MSGSERRLAVPVMSRDFFWCVVQIHRLLYRCEASKRASDPTVLRFSAAYHLGGSEPSARVRPLWCIVFRYRQSSRSAIVNRSLRLLHVRPWIMGSRASQSLVPDYLLGRVKLSDSDRSRELFQNSGPAALCEAF